jgi:prepilin-type N-terminal cleavage/methylation domain-containing protein
MIRKPKIRITTVIARLCCQRGFAMIELLVAFVVLALGLSAILTGVAIAMRSDGSTQAREIAFRLAQSRLEEAGISEALSPGYRGGQLDRNYRWRQTITAVPVGAQNAGAKSNPKSDIKSGKPADKGGVAAYWVEVEVQAADGAVARLSALKLTSMSKQ